MTAADLYRRPSRDEIAARVGAQLPGAAAPGGGARKETPGPLANFSVHLQARMRALGWTQETVQDRAGISAHIAAKAINGTGCDLALAGQLAALVGVDLAVMIGPYQCRTCNGEPPPGYACLECGTEGARA